MSRCQICKAVVPPRTPCLRVVVERRPVTYPRRFKVHRLVWIDGQGKRRIDVLDDPGGSGSETVREVIACPGCAP